jgi:hypothetical protein
MSWIDVTKELPPPNVRVKLSYGLVGIRAAVCDDWVTEGWILPSGIWSLKHVDNMPKFPTPTHWKYINK